MIRKDIEQWIDAARAQGRSDAEIRDYLMKSGWTKQQVDATIITNRTEDIHQARRLVPDATPSSGKAWLVGGAIAVVVCAALVYAGFQYGFPWEGNANGNSNALVSGYNSNRITTGSTDIRSLSAQLAAQSTIGKFENLDQVRSFLVDHEPSSYSSYYGGTRAFTSDIMVEEDMGTTFGLGTADLSAPQKSSGSEDYSRTNVQVEGVDEADIVKTDGEYVYTVSETSVFVIKAYPAGDAKIISTIVLDSVPTNLYINGDNLVIYGTESNISEKPFFEDIRPQSSYTYLKVFDVSDPANPEQVRDLTFEGSFVNSRMIGDYVYLVTAEPTMYVTDEYPIPLMIDGGKVSPANIDTTATESLPDIYYIDAPYDNYVYTSVSAVDITDKDSAVSKELYLTGSSENMYVSLENMYLVYTKYVSEYQLMWQASRDVLMQKVSEREQARIREIEAVSDRILSQEEKVMKIYTILSRYLEQLSDDEQTALQEQISAKVKQVYEDISKELEKTVIHKIALKDGELEYKGSGEVTGHVLNQFSMDESGDYFRIATTKGRSWLSSMVMAEDVATVGSDSDSYSNVYVLDKNLKVVGSVEELAKGEQIYSARFMQNRVYLVTFRQTDPLFAIDLQDPKNPKLLGELKVPGFSSYLHPYSDTLLIGLGKQATESGQVQGLKLSLYDVADVANMKEVDTYEMGDAGSDSIALNDHKAFLFDKEKNLLVVPVTLSKELVAGSYERTYTNGAMVFKVTPTGFELRKQIDHSDGSADDSDSKYYWGYSYYGTSVKRSLYIDSVLYTLSDKYLKAHSLDTLDEVKSLKLAPGDSGTDYTIIKTE
ncbi:MAG: beta-propeller domain-containing protein [Patescibacteria group bacterium]|nr:beta-propeller domain-containing protein [Patescibacteria group bacterium]MDD5715884.1 beta-propeller domain-containing protein [Patescibacteria group bacterium]